jgi:hypothetical protein
LVDLENRLFTVDRDVLLEHRQSKENATLQGLGKPKQPLDAVAVRVPWSQSILPVEAVEHPETKGLHCLATARVVCQYSHRLRVFALRERESNEG